MTTSMPRAYTTRPSREPHFCRGAALVQQPDAADGRGASDGRPPLIWVFGEESTRSGLGLMARKPIPDATQASVLLKSRRRCCLCFCLKGEDEVKKGQLAHLDWDNANAAEENLAFLCLGHHDEYDSTPGLSKGLRQREVKKWRDELYKEMEYRFQTVSAGPLTILYDEACHCFREDNKQCAIYRIAVRNAGQTTINNVGVKIRDITGDQQSRGDDLRRLVGLRLSVSANPTGLYSHPSAIPDFAVLLHPGDEAIFDFLRLCTLPGNYLVCHSSFMGSHYKPGLDQTPSGVLVPGRYAITLSAQGDNLGPVLERFQVASSATEVLFQRVAVAVP